jgi:N-acyl-L-homoserine lactone synthetase
MVQVIAGATNPSCRTLLAEMFRHRYQIFVREKGWDLKTHNGLEFDDYDTAETIYLIEFDGGEQIGASMRLNPTDRPFLLQDHFADMCEREIPRGKDTWELTRGAVSADLRRSGIYGRVICAMVEAALLWGVKKGIGIFSVEYLMKQMRFGLDAKPLGQPRTIDGEPNVAAEIVFDRETLERLRASFKITAPTIERLHLMPQQPKAA